MKSKEGWSSLAQPNGSPNVIPPERATNGKQSNSSPNEKRADSLLQGLFAQAEEGKRSVEIVLSLEEASCATSSRPQACQAD